MIKFNEVRFIGKFDDLAIMEKDKAATRARFSVISPGRSETQRISWPCVAYGKASEIAQRFKDGDLVLVIGRLDWIKVKHAKNGFLDTKAVVADLVVPVKGVPRELLPTDNRLY